LVSDQLILVNSIRSINRLISELVVINEQGNNGKTWNEHGGTQNGKNHLHHS
jgi:hypothetical protein